MDARISPNRKGTTKRAEHRLRIRPESRAGEPRVVASFKPLIRYQRRETDCSQPDPGPFVLTTGFAPVAPNGTDPARNGVLIRP